MVILSQEPLNGTLSKPTNPHLITQSQYNALLKQYEKICLSEESLSELPHHILQNSITQLENLQFQVQLALQGGTLLDDIRQGFETSQVQFNLNNLLDKIHQEIGLYKEFVNNQGDLDLDFILKDDLEVNEIESFDLNQDSFGDNSELGLGSESGFLSPQFSQSMYSETPTHSLRRPNTIPLPSMMDELDFEELRESSLSFQGELVRWVPLFKISDQLFSQKSRETIGYPTVIAINTVIAIGTTRGLVLLFDFQQKLINVIGSPALALEHGEVTSLAISSDSFYLAAGYAKGLILIYDLKTYQRIHSILPITNTKKQMHTQGSTITHLNFIPSNKPQIISSDHKGGVYIHKITNRMMMNSKETLKIFDASDLVNFIAPSENQYLPLLLDVEELPLGPRKHLTDSRGLVAILTPQLLTIMCVKPKPTVLVKLFRKHLESGVQAQRGKQYANFLDSGVAGTLAWFPCTQDAFTGQDTHPTLAFSFGKYICILQVTPSANPTQSKSKLKPKAKSTLEVVKVGDACSANPVVSLRWINRKNLIIVDNNERCSVIDIDDIDRTYYLGNLAGFSPLGRDPYSLYQLKPYDEKSNKIKQHLVYDQSISSYKSKLFILGLKQLYLGIPLTWSEHVFSLVTQGRTVDSVLLGLEYLRNGSPYYFSNLPTTQIERKERVKPVMIELMITLLNHLFSQCLNMVDDPSEISNPLVIHPLIIEAKEIVNSIIEASIEVEAFDWLLNDVYTMFVDADYNIVFYEALEPHLLSNPNSTLAESLPPALVQDLFRTYSENPHFLMRLDGLLVKINPALLDLDYTISLCRTHNMIQGLMFIWACAMHDFVSPIGELFSGWDQLPEEPSWGGELSPLLLTQPSLKLPATAQSTTNSAHKLFRYLSESLSGWQYPTKKPHSTEASASAWHQLVQWTINKELMPWPTSHQGKSITIPQLLVNDNKMDFDNLVYPYLTFLIKLDISLTVNYLELLDSRGLLVQTQVGDAEESTNLDESEDSPLQAIAHAIFDLLESETHFTSEEICQLQCFLVRLWGLERIVMDEHLIQSTFDTLTNPEHSIDFLLDSRQEACRILIRHPSISEKPNLDNVLERSGFLSLLKSRLFAKHDYTGAVRCYLKDILFFGDLIRLTDEAFKHKSITITKQQKHEIQKLLEDCLIPLIEHDSHSSVRLIDEWFDHDHHIVVRKLENHTPFLYRYMTEYFEHYPLKFRRQTPQDLLDQYILLKSQNDPQTLLPFLIHLSEDDITFNLEYCLRLSREYNVTDVTVWILERGGNPLGAMEEILEVLDRRASKLVEQLEVLQYFTKPNGSEPISVYDFAHQVHAHLIRVQSGVKIAVGLCDRVHLKQKQHAMASAESRRNSVIGKEQFNNDVEELYFKTLNFIVETLKLILNQFTANDSDVHTNGSASQLDRLQIIKDVRKSTVEAFRNLVQDVFNSILHPTSMQPSSVPGRSIISLPRILVHVMGSLNSNAPVLGELRDVIYGVLEACRGELRWLGVTLQLLHRDMFSLVHEDYRLRTKGLRGYGVRCVICKDRLIMATRTDDVAMFRCGHLVHTECLITKIERKEEWKCVKCHPPIETE